MAVGRGRHRQLCHGQQRPQGSKGFGIKAVAGQLFGCLRFCFLALLFLP